MRHLIWIANMALAMGLSSIALAETDTGSAAAIKSCETCHGPGGDSLAASTPRLNGQHAEYILARLRDFGDVTRETPHATYSMWQVVTNLGDSARRAIAGYFAGQAPSAAKPGSQALLGARIYQQGVPAMNVPACQSCHGPGGEGRGPIPRLAGQHADYLKTQMWVFSFQLRQNDVMHPNTRSMTGEQIDAVTSYLAND